MPRVHAAFNERLVAVALQVSGYKVRVELASVPPEPFSNVRERKPSIAADKPWNGASGAMPRLNGSPP